mgnify:CR=1 FL=1
MTITGHFNNGELLADGTRPEERINPATGKVEKTVSLSSKKTMKSAIGCVHAAFLQWHNTPPIKCTEYYVPV